MKPIFLIASLSILATVFAVSCGSGGGGGGGGSEASTEPAQGELTVEPATSEVGGQILVGIKISQVNANLAVKVRVPEVIRFELESARLIVGDQSYSIVPTVDVALPESSASSSTSSSSSSSSSSTSSASSSTSSSTSSSSSSSRASSSSSASSTAKFVLATTGTAVPTAVPEIPKRMLVFYIPNSILIGSDTSDLKFSLRSTDIVPSGKVELDIDPDNPDITNDVEFSATNPLFGAEDAISIRVKN